MNFVLDENLPPAFARALEAFAYPDGHVVAHLHALAESGTGDSDWIKILGNQEITWNVISGDRRMLTRKHELQALRDHKLTTFILAHGWGNVTFWDKAWLLVRWWPIFVELASAHPRGSIFAVPYRQVPKGLNPL